jgi:putative hemolysin
MAAMSPYIFDTLIIVVLLIFNSLLAMSEMALVAARKPRLTQWAEDGDAKAKLALEIANQPTPTLASIQIGISLAALITGIFGGATISDDLSAQLQTNADLKPYADLIAMTFTTALLTYSFLVIGELVPKRVALNFPETVAKLCARPLRAFCVVVSPLSFILTHSTEAIIRVMGLRQVKEPPVTEAEIHVMVQEATQAGIFEEVEQEMVASVLMLDNRKAGALMTPRRDIEWLDINEPEEEWLEWVFKMPHSRLIVAEASLDHILGVVETKELLQQKILGKVDIQSLLQQPLYVPENINALDLIQRFRESSQQVAIVLDEYGGMHGLISREDILEAIVGDLPAAHEEDRKHIRKQADTSWICEGQCEVDEFQRVLDIEELPGKDEGADYRTVAGLILYQLEHVPTVGEKMMLGNYEFTITKMDHHRIDQIYIRLIKLNP